MSRIARFTVTLSEPSDKVVVVDYETVPDTAQAGSDFTPVSGELVFAPGETTRVIEVPVRSNDQGQEEVFRVLLSNPINSILADEEGVCVLPVWACAPPLAYPSLADSHWGTCVNAGGLIPHASPYGGVAVAAAEQGYLSQLSDEGVSQWNKRFVSETWSGFGIKSVYHHQDHWVAALDVSSAQASALAVVGVSSQDGSVLWSRTLDTGAGAERAVSVATYGGCMFVALAASAGEPAQQALVLKLNEDGAIGWQAQLSMANDSQVLDITQLAITADEDLFVLTNCTDTAEAAVVKYRSNGQLAWQRKLDFLELGFYGAATSQGHLVVAGARESAAGSPYVVALLDAQTGSVLWAKDLTLVGGHGALQIQNVALDAQDNAYVWARGAAGSAVRVFKFSAEGALVWQHQLKLTGAQNMPLALRSTSGALWARGQSLYLAVDNSDTGVGFVLSVFAGDAGTGMLQVENAALRYSELEVAQVTDALSISQTTATELVSTPTSYLCEVSDIQTQDIALDWRAPSALSSLAPKAAISQAQLEVVPEPEGRTFATLSATDKHSSLTLSQDQLTVSGTDAGSVRASIGKWSGKWYWEVSTTTDLKPIVGTAHADADLDSYLGYDAQHWVYRGSEAKKYSGDTPADYGSVWQSTSEVIGVALDADAGTLTLYKNGVSMGEMYAQLGADLLFPIVGGDGSGAWSATVNFGASPFFYAPPQGYSAGLWEDDTGFAASTWDPVIMPRLAALSHGNLRALATGGDYHTHRSTGCVGTGRHYFEVRAGNRNPIVGVGLVTAPQRAYPGQHANSWSYYPMLGRKINDGVQTSYSATAQVGDVIGVALDLFAGTLSFFVNGVSQGVAFTGLSGEFYAMMGQDISGSFIQNANFGQHPWVYAPPPGHTGWPERAQQLTPDGYATWDSFFKLSGMALSEGSLVAVGDQNAAARSTVGVSSGKWYWEISSNGTRYPVVGVALAEVAVNNYPGMDVGSWGYYGLNARKINAGVQDEYGQTWAAAGDVVGVALDLDNHTLAFYKNGVSMGEAFAGLPVGTYHAFVAGDVAGSASHAKANFGPITKYAAPVGFNSGLYKGAPATLDVPVTAGLISWVDGSDAVTVLASGGSITGWQDKAQSRLWTPTGGAATPTVTATDFPRNAVKFPMGQNSYFTASNSVAFTSDDITVVMVTRHPPVAGSYSSMGVYAGETTYPGTMLFHSPESGGLMFQCVGISSTSKVVVGASGRRRVFVSQQATASANHLSRVEGAALSLSVGSGGGTARVFNRLGTFNSLYGANGTLAEMLIYDRRLTIAEVVALEQHLQAKWRTDEYYEDITDLSALPGALGWYDSSDLAAMVFEDNKVTELRNKAGSSNYDLVQPSEAARYVLTTQNGKPALSGAAGRYMDFRSANPVLETANFWAFAVFDNENTAGFLLDGAGNAGDPYLFGTTGEGAANVRAVTANGTINVTPGYITAQDSKADLWGICHDASNALFSHNSALSYFATRTGFDIRRFGGRAGFSVDGRICEVVFGNGFLSSGQVKAIKNYLGRKWLTYGYEDLQQPVLQLKFEGVDGASSVVDTGQLELQPTVGGIAPTIVDNRGAFAQNGELFFTHPRLAFGKGDWTVRGRFRFNAFSNTRGFFSFGMPTGAYTTANAMGLYVDLSGRLALWDIGGVGNFTNFVPVTGVDYDIEINRYNGDVGVFVNGVQCPLATQGAPTPTPRRTDSRNYTGTYLALGGYYSTVYRNDFVVDNFEVYAGRALHTTDFTPPAYAIEDASQDPLAEHVVLDWVASGSDGSAAFVDSSALGQTLYGYGNAQISTANAAYGGASGYFDGSGDYLDALAPSLNLSGGDYAVEALVYLDADALSANRAIYSTIKTSQSIGRLTFSVTASGSLQATEEDASGQNLVTVASPTGAIQTGQWLHLAVVKKGTSLRVYKNRDLLASATSAVHTAFLGYARIGRNHESAFEWGWKGYIQRVRVTRRASRTDDQFFSRYTLYPLSQIPDTVDPYYEQVVLDAIFSGPVDSTVFTDRSARAHNLITTGNPVMASDQSKYGATSVYLADSTAQNSISAPTNDDFALPGDFTLELLVRWSSTAAGRADNLFSMPVTNGFSIYWDGGKYNTNKLIVSNYAIDNPIAYNWSPPLGQWVHLAVRRTGATVELLIDKQVVASVALTTSFVQGQAQMLGSFADSAGLGTFHGHAQRIRLTKGKARSASEMFSLYSDYPLDQPPPEAPLVDPYYEQTVFLQGFDGADGSTAIVGRESTPKSGTAYGTAALSTANARNAGTALRVSGAASIVVYPHSSDYDLNHEDFTIEGWTYWNSFGSDSAMLSKWLDDGDCWTVFTDELGYLGFSCNAGGGSPDIKTYKTNVGLTAGRWFHWAVVRDLDTLRFYVDGVEKYSNLINVRITSSALSKLMVGMGVHTDFYVDELRLTKGVARYRNAFTAPVRLGSQAPAVAARGVRRNLLTGSAAMHSYQSSAAQISVVHNVDIAPDGTLTADMMHSGTASFAWFSLYLSALATGQKYTLSRYVKAGSATWVTLGLHAHQDAFFDLANLTAAASGPGVAATDLRIIDVGDGWRRVSASWIKDSATVYRIYFAIAKGVGDQTLVSPNRTVLSWGHQFELGDLTDYQPVASGGEFLASDPHESEVVFDWVAVGLDATASPQVEQSRWGRALTGSPIVTSTKTAYAGGLSATFSSTQLSCPMGGETDFGTGDFTIEALINPSAGAGAARNILGKFSVWNSDLDFILELESATGKLSFVAGDNAAIWIRSADPIALNQWSHVAIVRKDGVTSMAVNRVVQTDTHSGSVQIRNDRLTMGIGHNGYGLNYFAGNIQRVRITRAARSLSQLFSSTSLAPVTSA